MSSMEGIVRGRGGRWKGAGGSGDVISVGIGRAEATLEADVGELFFQASEDGGEGLDGGGLGVGVEAVGEDGSVLGEEGEYPAVGDGPAEVGADGV